METLIATLLGVIASLLAWLTVTQSLRPLLAVSDFVSRIPNDDGTPRYRIKIQNARRTRNVVDVKASIYVWIPGYWSDRATNSKVVHLEATSSELVGLRPGDDRVLVLDVSPLASVLDLSQHPNDALETALRLGATKHAELRIWLSFTDGFSGVRRAERFEYKADNIEACKFSGTGVGRGDAM